MYLFGYFFNQVTAHKKPKKELQKLGEWGTLKVWLIIAIAIDYSYACNVWINKMTKKPKKEKCVWDTWEGKLKMITGPPFWIE